MFEIISDNKNTSNQYKYMDHYYRIMATFFFFFFLVNIEVGGAKQEKRKKYTMQEVKNENWARTIWRKHQKRRKQQKIIKNISKEALSNKKHNQQFQKTHCNKIALDSTEWAIFRRFGLFEFALQSERKPEYVGNF